MGTTDLSAAYAPAEGHDPGHPPGGLVWADVVGALVREHGGWTALAEELVRRGKGAFELPRDLGSIERGLRRLSGRGQREGRPVRPLARALLRHAGRHRALALVARPVPPPLRGPAGVDARASSSSGIDRRCATRRPGPGSTSAWPRWPCAGDRAGVDARLARAASKLGRASAALRLEHGLFAARIASEDGDRAAEARLALSVEALLGAPELSAEDAACYRARLLDAKAYRLLHPDAGVARLAEARACYEAIEGEVPFALMRRALGLAYCDYREGARASALSRSLEAAEHAADGGLVRFRVMAFNLASRAADGPEASRLRERARRLSLLLEDEDLRARVER
ncbi:MAG: hypothetical protein M5U28_08340 [Sandaracinaceae bacterium]|nr:hypothetical protein [Sandaracinaceae bacterium]